MTDIINLEDLPYPMFETTEEEKEELREVLKVYPIGGSSWLCDYTEGSLRLKIQKSLEDIEHAFITGYVYEQAQLEFEMSYDTFLYQYRYEVRKIWINKLLAYEGE